MGTVANLLQHCARASHNIVEEREAAVTWVLSEMPGLLSLI